MKINTPEWKEYAKQAMLIPISKHVEMAEKNLRGIKTEKGKEKEK